MSDDGVIVLFSVGMVFLIVGAIFLAVWQFSWIPRETTEHRETRRERVLLARLVHDEEGFKAVHGGYTAVLKDLVSVDATLDPRHSEIAQRVTASTGYHDLSLRISDSYVNGSGEEAVYRAIFSPYSPGNSSASSTAHASYTCEGEIVLNCKHGHWSLP
jgi:hypothetical protein